jgi:N-acetylmuramoyl-L-alanine amidase
MLMVPAAATELAPPIPTDDNVDPPEANPLSVLPNYLRRDAEGYIIQNLDTTNPMVERDRIGRNAAAATPTTPAVTAINPITDASTQRIAWREVKVKIGKVFAGSTVTWTMRHLFTPHRVTTPGTATTPEITAPDGDPRFRGSWAHAIQAYRQSFTASQFYGANGFEPGEPTSESTPGTASTTVDPNGYTAIRVNLPPIAFNKARVSIQIDALPDTLDLIDHEVPAVVVIDPGHGVGPIRNDSKDGTTGKFTNVREHDTVWDIGNRMLSEFRQTAQTENLVLSSTMTRQNRNNVTFSARKRVGREQGADLYLSIHFNNDGEEGMRHPFGQTDSSSNLNRAEDWALCYRVRRAVQFAISEVEPGERHNAAHHPQTSEGWERNTFTAGTPLATLRDGAEPHNGNQTIPPVYAPCRAALIEIEWVQNSLADQLFNGNTGYNEISGAISLTHLANQMRGQTATRLVEACINDQFVRDTANEPQPIN